ncbi:PAS domain S-box protein [Microvirga arabica]|uniref:Blue-light-activated histidine kinase n=1 Tax=Microvirga arabica TaxID=1128671 RepID=A0ABV6Y5P3_9HYPH
MNIHPVPSLAAHLPGSDALAHVITDHAGDAIFLMDTVGRITFANPAAQRIFGWDRDELIGKVLHDLLHHHYPDGSPYPAEDCPVARAYKAGDSLAGTEEVFFHKDGRQVHVSCSIAPILNGNEIIGSVLTAQDITQRKQTEAALRDSEAFARSILDSSPDCVKVVDLNGRLLYMNGPGQHLMEVDDFSCIFRQGWSDLWPKEAREKIDYAIEQAKGGRSSSFSAFCPTAKGTPKWWEVTVTPVFGDDGQVKDILSSSRDITERKQREEALQAALKRNADILESISDYYFAADRDWTITAVNRKVEEKTGRSRDEIVGRRVWDVFPDAAPAEIYGSAPSEGDERRVSNTEFYSRVLGVWVEATIYRDGNGIEAYFRDISARKEAEEQQHLMTRELHHRVKNTLSTVQAVISATARRAETINEFYQSVTDRIMSLSKTHTLLVNNTWGGATMEDLFRVELEAYENGDSSRIRLEGPHVLLPSEVALAIGMAAHELTTNAAKYGALSLPDGQVEVSWALDPEHLTLRWAEMRGPPVQKPSRQGFGSVLFERVLGRQLRGEVTIDYAPDGLCVSLRAPLVNIQPQPMGAM